MLISKSAVDCKLTILHSIHRKGSQLVTATQLHC